MEVAKIEEMSPISAFVGTRKSLPVDVAVKIFLEARHSSYKRHNEKEAPVEAS